MSLKADLVMDSAEARLSGVTGLLDWLLVNHPMTEPISEALDCVNKAQQIVRSLTPLAGRQAHI